MSPATKRRIIRRACANSEESDSAARQNGEQAAVTHLTAPSGSSIQESHHNLERNDGGGGGRQGVTDFEADSPIRHAVNVVRFRESAALGDHWLVSFIAEYSRYMLILLTRLR